MEVARFDWGITLPFDQDGDPIIYIAVLKAFADSTQKLDSIQIIWHSYNHQTRSYEVVSDLSILDQVIADLAINPWDNGSAPRGVVFSDLTKPVMIRCDQAYPESPLYISKTRTAADEGKTFIGGITVQYQQLGANMALNWWFEN